MHPKASSSDAGILEPLFVQFLEEGAGKEVVALGQDSGELRVVLLDVAHGGIDLRVDGLGFGAVEPVIKPSLSGQIRDAFSVIGGGFIQPGTASRRRGHFLKLGALGGEADFGEAQEDEAEDGRRIFLGFEP